MYSNFFHSEVGERSLKKIRNKKNFVFEVKHYYSSEGNWFFFIYYKKLIFFKVKKNMQRIFRIFS